MRLLKQSTVERELKRRGWHHIQREDDSSKIHFMMDGSCGARLFATVENGRVVIKDGRLQSHPNVHIVTYLGPFRSMDEMRKELDTSEEVYSDLCGTRFPPT